MASETIELLTHRASCRAFFDRPVPAEVLREVLAAGVRAPSGGNLQPYSIIQVERQDARDRLARLCGNQAFIARAPVGLLFCIDWRRLERWARLSAAPFTATRSFRHFWISFQDTVICAQSVAVAAAALGLGSVYVGTVLECFRDLKTMFRLPPGVFPVVLLSLGYPADPVRPRQKLGVDVIVHRETYGEIDDDELARVFDEKHADAGVEVTEERLATIAAVCRNVHDEEFAAACLARIREGGRINAAQRYFGLHYAADRMPEGNERYLAIFKEFGFGWFEESGRGVTGPSAVDGHPRP